MKFKLNLNKKHITILIVIIIILIQSSSKKNNLINNQKNILIYPTNILNKNKIETAKIIRVIDGDTIEIKNGQKIRYIGINSPELHDPRRKVECFAKQAYEENKKLVEGKTVNLEKDISNTDKYKRLLRYVWVDNIFINDYLVRQGFALTSTFPPDTKYANQFIEAEKEARENNRGLWKNCFFNKK